MKSAVKFLFCLGLLCVILPYSLYADTIYTYTGNPYATCQGVYYCGPGDTSPLSLSITFDLPLTGVQLDNLGFAELLPSSLSITDGTGLYITQANAFTGVLEISTGPTGAIIGWYIWFEAYEPYPPPIGYLRFMSSYFGSTVGDQSSISCICFEDSSLAFPVGTAFTAAAPPRSGAWSSYSTPSLESSAATPIPESSAATPIPESPTLLPLGALLGILVLWQKKTVRWSRTITGRRRSHRWL